MSFFQNAQENYTSYVVIIKLKIKKLTVLSHLLNL